MFDPQKSAQKDTSLELIEKLKVAVDSEQIDTAADYLAQLQRHITDWRKSSQIQEARLWLDEALAGELLVFNGEQARRYLEQWRSAHDDENTAEIDAYEVRVREQSQRKQAVIHVRGVMSHCDELLEQAAELEKSSSPPNPQFLIENYYSKVLDIATAAKAEIRSSPELDVLQRRVEQLHGHKVTAARIYPVALEDDKYTDALTDLDKLPVDMLIPRFVLVGGDDRRTTFSNMVMHDDARTEIRRQAQTWAEAQAKRVMQSAQAAMDAHQPEEAVEELGAADQWAQLLTPETRITLSDVRQRATTILQSKQKAHELAQQAAQIAPEDDFQAWTIYGQARALYESLDELADTKQTILEQMRKTLNRMVKQADKAFQERNMERVRELYQRGQSQYAEVDASLAAPLERLTEFNEMTQQYDEYLQTANSLYKQVRDLLWQDSVGANDILTQLESYPDIVLEAFPDLYDTRQQVNERLSADTLYGDLYPKLFADSADEVRAAFEETKAAVEDYPGDSRFPVLRDALNMHLYFINAQQKLQAGKQDEAVEALRAVAGVNGHPDQERAQKLLNDIAPGDMSADTE